jgi:hypothetical protein
MYFILQVLMSLTKTQLEGVDGGVDTYAPYFCRQGIKRGHQVIIVLPQVSPL